MNFNVFTIANGILDGGIENRSSNGEKNVGDEKSLKNRDSSTLPGIFGPFCSNSTLMQGANSKTVSIET